MSFKELTLVDSKSSITTSGELFAMMYLTTTPMLLKSFADSSIFHGLTPMYMILMEKDKFGWITWTAMVPKIPLNTAIEMIGEITTVVTVKMLVSFVRVLWEVTPPHNQLWMVPSLMETSELSLIQLKVKMLVSLSSSMIDNGDQYVMTDLPT